MIWFRIAAALMLLFAAGHTFGFLTFRPSLAEGQAVWAAMNRVHFTNGRGIFSYGNFYIGFGLSISAAMVFAAWLLWLLGSWASSGNSRARAVAWGIVAWQIVGMVLSLRYFSVAPAIFSALEVIFVALGAISTRRRDTIHV